MKRILVMLPVALVLLLVAAVSAVTAPAPASATSPVPGGYHVTKKFPVGGEGGWDYLTFDGDGHRLFITRGTRVIVVDPDSGKVTGEIPGLQGTHGVALAPDLGRGFISDGRANKVVIFDLKTLKTLGDVATGQNPDAILYDPPSHLVFAFNGRSADATAIDGATGKVTGTISLGGRPEFAATDLKGSVFVNIEDKSEVVSLSTAKLAVVNRWKLAPCEEPSGMAIDRNHQRLVIGCSNKMAAIVDTTSGKVVATPPIGQGVDANGFDPGTNLGFASNGEGTLTVIRADSADKWTVAENVPTQKGARTMALDDKTHTVYLVTAEFGPPPPATKEQPRPRGAMVKDSFTVLVVGR
ncbi:MAG TPA: YncE family protein [Thermoanaerobaculia bacterium]|nr:YncE family protein [Thermoanaerobaculia bacterium]